MSSLLTRANRNRLKDRDEQPLRAELFSTDQLEQHAKAMAGWHEVDKRTGPDRLLNRLEKNERVLLKAHQMIVATVATNRRMSPADEWLLDNFYLIEEQIRTARRHLPKNYSTELPRLRYGPLDRVSAGVRHCAGTDLARRRPDQCRKSGLRRGGVPDRSLR